MGFWGIEGRKRRVEGCRCGGWRGGWRRICKGDRKVEEEYLGVLKFRIALEGVKIWDR